MLGGGIKEENSHQQLVRVKSGVTLKSLCESVGPDGLQAKVISNPRDQKEDKSQLTFFHWSLCLIFTGVPVSLRSLLVLL